jgi:hypothetical protein
VFSCVKLFFRRTCDESGFTEEEQTPMNIEYDTLLDLIEHLKAAADIASNRTKNWQAYCLKNKSKLTTMRAKISCGDFDNHVVFFQALCHSFSK